jgi:hypothetical protein
MPARSGTVTHRQRPSAVAWYVTAGLLVASTAWSGLRAPSGATSEDALRPRAEASQLRLRARLLQERGELGEAIDVAARAAMVAPTDPRSHALLGALQSLGGHTHQMCARYTACVIRADGDDSGCRHDPKRIWPDGDR